MKWEIEHWVKLYTRDTVTWSMLCWQARCLLPLLLRKVDDGGVMDLASAGYAGVARAVDVPMDVVEPGMAGLVSAGVVAMDREGLVLPNFDDAQSARSSDAERQRRSRAARRAQGLTRIRDGGADSWTPTNGNDSTRVTAGHSGSQRVTTRLEETRLDNTYAGFTRSLFAFWVELSGKKRCRLTPALGAKFAAALKTFTEEDLRLAIKGFVGDPWRRDKPTAQGLQLMFRDINRFMEMAGKSRDDLFDEVKNAG